MKRRYVILLALCGIPLLLVGLKYASFWCLVFLALALSETDTSELSTTPDPARVGEVRFELSLPQGIDNQYNKRVEWVAYPLPDAAPRLQGSAVEDDEEALYRFSANFDRAGPWRVETAAFWSDGREYARGEFDLQVAP